jgi:hypothetical protein
VHVVRLVAGRCLFSHNCYEVRRGGEVVATGLSGVGADGEMRQR